MSETSYWRPPALMFGVPIDNLSMEETLNAVGELVVSGRQRHRTHQIATVNVDFVVNALGDRTIKQLLQRADLCLADGVPVVWGARTLGMPLIERVPGADLVPALAERATTTGWKIHLFGSAEGIAERAAKLLLTRHPGVAITAESGPMISDMAQVGDEVLDKIAAIDPDILCVALGNPKQEQFIDAFRARLKTPLMLGIGGSLDMLVGDKRRAPEWVQRVGLEWLIRTAQEPARLGKRYTHDAAVFFPRLASERRIIRREQYRGGIAISIAGEADDLVVVSGSSTDATAETEWTAALNALADGASFDLSVDTEPLTIRALTQLVGLIRAARRYGSPIVNKQIADPILSQAAALGLVEFVRDTG